MRTIPFSTQNVHKVVDKWETIFYNKLKAKQFAENAHFLGV